MQTPPIIFVRNLLLPYKSEFQITEFYDKNEILLNGLKETPLIQLQLLNQFWLARILSFSNKNSVQENEDLIINYGLLHTTDINNWLSSFIKEALPFIIKHDVLTF